MPPSERTIEFGYLKEGTQVEAIQQQQEHDNNLQLGRIVDAIPKFTKSRREFFSAEYALKDGAIVIHFFQLDITLPWNTPDYWRRAFAVSLDRVARDYFGAQAPRLRAKFTEELNSWWFQANGYGHIVDLSRFIKGFFEALDVDIAAARE